jgi:hypothetical protein
VRHLVLSVLFTTTLFFNLLAQSQKINIDADGTLLNEVFIRLRDKYNFQFTFDDKSLSNYKITAHREFETKEAVVSYLLQGIPFEFEKNGDVFVIFPSQKTTANTKNKITNISGQVVEAETYEPLPFSYILINNRQVQSDQNGNFNFLASADTSFNMQISHLGYFVYDTLFSSSLNQQFELTPSVTQLKEVKVEGFDVERATLIGDAAGHMKINHTIAPYLPGYGDNAVYNVLRLMPGVLASGEQSSDLLVWGGYEGQSKVELDGFTIFGLKNFNDNIGVVNPLLIKTIRVLKGGYEAGYGDRVGGIIRITGKNGNRAKPSITINVNNSTVNSLVEIPVSRKSTLVGAYRQTYYELYNPYDLNIFGHRDMSNSANQHNGNHNNFDGMVDVLVVPDYKFSDANLKYTYRGEKDDIFSASFYSGGDRYSYDIEREFGNFQLGNNYNERNKQFGASAGYSKFCGNNHKSEISISHSKFDNETTEFNSSSEMMGNNGQHGMGHESDQSNNEIVQVDNETDESFVEIVHHVSLINGIQLDLGLDFQQNNVLLYLKEEGQKLIDLNGLSEKYTGFVQGTIPVNKKLIAKPGLRAIYENETGQLFYEPRLIASYNLFETVKLNAAWGQYHQFISKTSFVDNNLNYSWFWTVSDGKTIPALNAQHWVGGISYNKNDFLLSVEGYLKKTDGITRYYNETLETGEGFYSGKSRSYGIDFYLKKEYKKNVAWVSYTLSKVEENFTFDPSNRYRLAPHDQRHELKFAGIYNWKSLYFSANYVYGSGFEIMKSFNDDDTSIPFYSRLDAAVVYKFSKGKVYGNLGLSVLNVLNRANIKYSNLRRVESSTSEIVNVHSEAIPFTPSLFLKLGI